MSDLVSNPKDRISGVVAHIHVYVCRSKGLNDQECQPIRSPTQRNTVMRNMNTGNK